MAYKCKEQFVWYSSYFKQWLYSCSNCSPGADYYIHLYTNQHTYTDENLYAHSHWSLKNTDAITASDVILVSYHDAHQNFYPHLHFIADPDVHPDSLQHQNFIGDEDLYSNIHCDADEDGYPDPHPNRNLLAHIYRHSYSCSNRYLHSKFPHLDGYSHTNTDHCWLYTYIIS